VASSAACAAAGSCSSMLGYMAERACSLCMLQCSWRSALCRGLPTVRVPRAIDKKCQYKDVKTQPNIVYSYVSNVDAVKVLW